MKKWLIFFCIIIAGAFFLPDSILANRNDLKREFIITKDKLTFPRLNDLVKNPLDLFWEKTISEFGSLYQESKLTDRDFPEIEIFSCEVYFKDNSKIKYYSDESDVVYLPFDHVMFIVEFVIPDSVSQWGNVNYYKYLLEGYYDEWINIGVEQKVIFTKIPPGEYIFRVKRSGNDIIWESEGALLKIIIEFPFWKNKYAYFFYVVLIISLVYLIIQYRTRNLRKQNKQLIEKQNTALIIAKQKEELSLQNRNITDSLNYAQKIQKAIMSSDKLFNTLLPNSFIFHKPKDIVSGDFFWINENNNKIYVAAVDCTGHGVPGAFMSIIGFELFRNITRIDGLIKPSQILDKLNKDFSLIFKDVDNIALRDGMDLALCSIDKHKRIIEFAGAFNPMYLIRDNKIIEKRGDRLSVGLGLPGSEPSFTNHTISLEKDDMIYIFSDGYADQFGGAEGKKYKYRRFRHLLLNIHKLPMKEQKTLLLESIERWQGSYDQIDDMLVIGISANL